MPLSRLFIDNDIFILVAGAGLLEEAVTALGFTFADVYRLEALPFVVSSGKRQSRFPVEVVESVLQQCQQVNVLRERPSDALLQMFVATPAVDAGEAVLYALVAEQPSAFLTSGDKRAMRAIAQEPTLSAIRTAVAGRVICLEALLLKLIKARSVATVGAALTPVLPLNTMLRAVFTSNSIAQPTECIQALTSYQQMLRKEVGANFLWQDD
ncbi:MAG: hypothetical protein DYG89_27570 [Caldilinea sp. CFX5]|nr:hypothetical protein [Caldilinea sp. CFX5]